MDKRLTARLKDSNPRNGRLRVNLKFQNPLTGVRSSKFRIHHNMAESISNHTAMNGTVELKNVQSVDFEQNYANLRESLNGRTAELKQKEIVGPTGTVRGFKNIIKDRQKNFDKLNSLAALTEVSYTKLWRCLVSS